MAGGGTLRTRPDTMHLLYHEAKDLLALQRADLAELNRTGESFIRLTVAAMAGPLALFGLMASSAVGIRLIGFTGFAVGSGPMFVAVILFVSITTGSPHPVVGILGPRLDRPITLVEHEDPNVTEMEWHLVVNIEETLRVEGRRRDEMALAMARGTFILVAGAAVLLVTLA